MLWPYLDYESMTMCVDLWTEKKNRQKIKKNVKKLNPFL